MTLRGIHRIIPYSLGLLFCVGLISTLTAQTLPFYDSFESPNDLSNWSVSGVTINGGTVYSGAQSARIDHTSPVASSMTLSLDMSEYQGSNDVELSFFWRDGGTFEPVDSLLVEIYDGSWKEAYVHTDDQDSWTEVSVDLDSVGNFIAGYQVRFSFRWDGSGNIEYVYIDSLRITGTTAHVPDLTGPGGAGSISASQLTDGSKTVLLNFEVSDQEQDSVYITADFRQGAAGVWGPMTLTNLSGDTGWIPADNGSAARTVYWDAGAELPNIEATDYQVRLTANDGSNGSKDSTTVSMAAADLEIDTKDPAGTLAFSTSNATISTVDLSWTPVTETNFQVYRVWYGTDESDVTAGTGSAVSWDDDQDGSMSTRTTGSTTVTRLNPDTKFYFSIFGIDNHGNELTGNVDSASTLPSSVPNVTGWDPYLPVRVFQRDSDAVITGYEVNDLESDSVSVSLEYSLQDGGWIPLSTDISGATGTVATSPTANDTVVWDIKTAFGSGYDSTAIMRVIADDGLLIDTTVSDSFVIDTRQPSGLDNFICTDSSFSSATFSWDAVTESNFSHYELWYGIDRGDVEGRSGASEFDGDNNADLLALSTSSTTIGGLLPDTKYYFGIWAQDSFGYESTTGIDSCVTDTGMLPWYDGFESGLGNWTTFGLTDVTVDPTYVYAGTQAAELSISGEAGIYASLDMRPYQGSKDVELSFWFKDAGGWEPEDSVFVDVYDGSWHTAWYYYDDQNSFKRVVIDIDDLGYEFTNDFRIRFRFQWDGSGNQERMYIDDVTFSGTLPYPPKLTGLANGTYITASQSTDGSGVVSVSFETGDSLNDSVYVSCQYRKGSQSYSPATSSYVSGNIGALPAQQFDTDRTIYWSVLDELPSVEADNYQVRLVADNHAGSLYDSTATEMEGPTLSIDTRAPQNLSNFNAVDSTQNSISLAWDPCADLHFDHYEIWYGTLAAPVSNRDVTASEWDDSDDGALTTASTSSTTVTGLVASTRFYFCIWAVDAFGFESTTGLDSLSTVSTSTPVVTGWDPSSAVSTVQTDSNTVLIGYEVSDIDNANVNVNADYRIGTGSYLALNTNMTGDTGSIATSLTENDTITWDIEAVFGGDVDTACTVRVIANDGGTSDTGLTTNFTVDRRPPVGLSNFTHTDSSYNEATFSWTPPVESNFSAYNVYFGVSKANVESRSGASLWSSPDDASLATRTTSSTTVHGLTYNTKYFFKMWAVDDFGYEEASTTDSVSTLAGILPFVDDFESGLGNWNSANAGTAGGAYSGALKADLQPAAGTFIETDLDLSLYQGATDVSLTLYWMDAGTWETIDSMVLSVLANGVWDTLYTHADDQDSWLQLHFDLDSAIELASDFKLRVDFCWDGSGNGEHVYVDSVALVGSVPTAPKLTGFTSQPYLYASQSSNGSQLVSIEYETGDNEQDSVFITGAYREGPLGTWIAIQDTTCSGHVGRLYAGSPTTDRTLVWNIGQQLPGIESDTFQIRLTANDEGGGYYDSTTTGIQNADLRVDTKLPQGLDGLSCKSKTATSDKLIWNAATDLHFDHYEIWYGTSLADVLSRSGSAVAWDNNDDADMEFESCDSTIIPGLSTGLTYYFKIWGIDEFGNEDTAATISVVSETMVAPAWSRTALGEVMGGAVADDAIYITTGAGGEALQSINSSSGATNWSYSTSAYGQCTMPTYAYNPSGNRIVLSAGTYLLGRVDNGSSSSQLFAPVNLGSDGGTPYISPDDSTVYVTCTNKIHRRKLSNGASMTGWPQILAGVSTSADPVIFRDEIFVATTAGEVHKYDLDGTPQGTYDAGTLIDLPLLVDSATMYVAPATNELHAFNINTMAAKWGTPATLAAANSGPAFSPIRLAHSPSGVIYCAVGDTIQRVRDQGASAGTSWKIGVSDTVTSGPIEYETHVFFGSEDGAYYAIDTTAGAIVADWPYTATTGASNKGPWIDSYSGKLIFGTTGGNLDGFDLP